jgi:hypothetical protein
VLNWRKENPFESFIDRKLDYFRTHPFERIVEEWPEMPWLEIPQEDRGWYLEVHNTVAKWSWEGFDEWLKLQHTPVAAFTVSDWGKSDHHLKKNFAKWLKTKRPEDVPIRERRGHLAPRSQVGSWLKALGAWRLWRLAGMSHNQILNHGEVHERLYEHQPDLSKAIRLAATHLDYTDQPYRPSNRSIR